MWKFLNIHLKHFPKNWESKTITGFTCNEASHSKVIPQTSIFFFHFCKTNAPGLINFYFLCKKKNKKNKKTKQNKTKKHSWELILPILQRNLFVQTVLCRALLSTKSQNRLSQWFSSNSDMRIDCDAIWENPVDVAKWHFEKWLEIVRKLVYNSTELLKHHLIITLNMNVTEKNLNSSGKSYF